MTTQLTFNTATLSVINRNNQIWFSATDLATALNYKRPDSVSTLYNRNQDEFTSCMTQTVNLTFSGNYQKTVRIFSLRGAHLVAMLANTDIAKDFRRWLLDLADKEVGNTITQIAVKPIEQIHHITLTDTELYNLTWLYRVAEHMLDNITKITPALYAIKSEQASLFNTIAKEHKWVVEDAKKIIINITKHVDPENFKWRTVLPKLRNQF